MNIDELKDLELIAAFARALGYEVFLDVPAGTVRVITHPSLRRNSDGIFWTELPADLILKEFNRLKPSVSWNNDNGILFCGLSIYESDESMEVIRAEGPNLEVALARLVIKEKEKE